LLYKILGGHFKQNTGYNIYCYYFFTGRGKRAAYTLHEEPCNDFHDRNGGYLKLPGLMDVARIFTNCVVISAIKNQAVLLLRGNTAKYIFAPEVD
jgi:hypothetical protein